jgi:hypothetical protein
MQTRLLLPRILALTMCSGLAQQPLQHQTSDDYWTDSATHLMWTKKDNGTVGTQREAVKYCADLRLGGFSDWRVPEIDELAGLYDPAVPQRRHIRGGINLEICCAWSGTPGENSGEAWEFNFHLGRRKSLPVADRDYEYMVVCARRA